MEDISKELGISKKTLYQFFQDKNQLVNSVMEVAFNEEIVKCEEVYQMSKNPIDEIIISLKMFREMMTTINPILFYDLEKYYPEAWEKYQDLRQYIVGIVKRNLEEGITQKYYRENINTTILSKIRVEMIDLIFRKNLFDYNTENMFDIQEQSTDLFLRGIMTPIGLDTYLNIIKQ